jgi:hypothetical protein
VHIVKKSSRVSCSTHDKAEKNQAKMPVVFVISPDWTLRTMVRAELREAGIMALGMEATSDLEKDLRPGVAPSVIVLDGIELVDAAVRKMLEALAQDVAVLVLDSAITPALTFPCTEVLRRPVQVRDVVSRVFARLGRKMA